MGYLSFFYPIVNDSQSLSLLIALALVWLVIGINIRSVEGSIRLQVITTILKIIPLLLLIVLGLANAQPELLPPLNPTELHPFTVIATATTLVMWSFTGIETAAVPTENMAEPEKTIPRVLIASVLTVLVIYFLVSLAIALVVPADELIGSTAPFALAASKLMGPVGGAIISIGALISTLGSLNANALVAGQVPLAAARDGLMPKRFLTLSRSGTPVFCFLISGVFASILLMLNLDKGLVSAFTFIITLSTLSTLLAYAFSAVSEFYFLKNDKAGIERTRAIVLSSAAFIYTFFAIWGAGTEVVFYSFILILIGLPVYALIRTEQ